MSAAIVTFPGARAAELGTPDLIAKIDRISANFERPRLAVVGCEVIVERDSQYWRRAEWDFHNDMRRHGCRCCLGTGEMLVYIDEPAEPCAKCQRVNPYTYPNAPEEQPF